MKADIVQQWRQPPKPVRPCQRCAHIEDGRNRPRNTISDLVLYALRSTIGGREIVKFGQSFGVKGRLAAISKDMPEPVEVLGMWTRTPGDLAVHTLLLDRVGEVEELPMATQAGRMEWYYRDAEIDRVLEILQSGDPVERRRLAKAAAWVMLGIQASVLDRY